MHFPVSTCCFFKEKHSIRINIKVLLLRETFEVWIQFCLFICKIFFFFLKEKERWMADWCVFFGRFLHWGEKSISASWTSPETPSWSVQRSTPQSWLQANLLAVQLHARLNTAQTCRDGLLVKRQTRDRKVASSNPSRTGGRFFFSLSLSPELTFCADS